MIRFVEITLTDLKVASEFLGCTVSQRLGYRGPQELTLTMILSPTYDQ